MRAGRGRGTGEGRRLTSTGSNGSRDKDSLGRVRTVSVVCEELECEGGGGSVVGFVHACCWFVDPHQAEGLGCWT